MVKNHVSNDHVTTTTWLGTTTTNCQCYRCRAYSVVDVDASTSTIGSTKITTVTSLLAFKRWHPLSGVLYYFDNNDSCHSSRGVLFCFDDHDGCPLFYYYYYISSFFYTKRLFYFDEPQVSFYVFFHFNLCIDFLRFKLTVLQWKNSRPMSNDWSRPIFDIRVNGPLST